MSGPSTAAAYDLEAHLVAAIAEAQAYRTLAQEGIHALHALQARYDRLSDQHHHLVEAYRALRAARDGEAA